MSRRPWIVVRCRCSQASRQREVQPPQVEVDDVELVRAFRDVLEYEEMRR